ncbi:MAG: hypothetical protein ACREKH_04745, partial [Candidatus Rokuibacteriota bacterium]
EADCNPCRRAVRFTLRNIAPGDAALGDASPRDAVESSPPSLLVFDARGRLVRTLPAVSESATWDLRDTDGRLVPAGVYWAQTARGRLGGGTRIVVLR